MENYWSCTAISDLIRGTPKLKSGTSKEWSDWYKLSKQKHPVRYWISENLLDTIQDVIYSPVTLTKNIDNYINNRFIHKTHVLSTGFKPGDYYDFDSRIIHGLFNELVNFVEVDKAWRQAWCDKENRKKYKPKRFGVWRSEKAGIDHLIWESNLVYDEDYGTKPGDKLYGKQTSQALVAEQIILLYNWWKYIRPERKDPMDLSGWSEYCDEKRQKTGDELGFLDRDKESKKDRARIKKMLDSTAKIEKEQYDEDTKMLIKLITIRNQLW